MGDVNILAGRLIGTRPLRRHGILPRIFHANRTSRLRAPVPGSTEEIGRAITEALTANGAGFAIDGRKKADVERVIGRIRSTVPSGRLVRAPGGAVAEAAILFNNVST
jgi:hypothetical protein